MVVVEADHLHAGHQAREAAEQARVGAVPAVDGLVGIPHGTEVGAAAHQRLDQAELGRVDVLELVDREVPVAPPHALGEGGVITEQIGRADEHVVEVERPATAKGELVGVEGRHDRVDGDDGGPSRGGRSLGIGRGGQAAGLGPPDLQVDRRRGGRVTHDGVDRAVAVLGDHRWRLSRVEGMTPEQGQRQLVEGPRPDAWARDTASRGRGGDRHTVEPEAPPQLVGGLAGERAHHSVVRIGRAVLDPTGHPQSEDPRLPRAGTGHDAQ